MDIELTQGQFILFIIIAVIISLTVLIIFVKIIRRYMKAKGADEDIKVGWEKIEKLMTGHDEQSCKLAILEADKLLDQVLKRKMLAGSTLGERLKLAGYKFPKLRQVWPAHKIRNRLVHETDFKFSYKEIRWAIKKYKEALKELGAL